MISEKISNGFSFFIKFLRTSLKGFLLLGVSFFLSCATIIPKKKSDLSLNLKVLAGVSHFASGRPCPLSSTNPLETNHVLPWPTKARSWLEVVGPGWPKLAMDPRIDLPVTPQLMSWLMSLLP